MKKQTKEKHLFFWSKKKQYSVVISLEEFNETQLGPQRVKFKSCLGRR